MQIMFCTSRSKPHPDCMLSCKDMNFLNLLKIFKGIGNIEVSDVIGAIHLKMLLFFFIMYSPFINTRKTMFLK